MTETSTCAVRVAIPPALLAAEGAAMVATGTDADDRQEGPERAGMERS